jgi:hypothetical protein
MNHAFLRRAPAVAAAATALLAVTASAASAATIIAGTPCARYLPGLAGEQWVPISGTGFTPGSNPTSNSIELRYTNNDLGGFTPLAADGSFSIGVFMPTEFIRSSTGRTKTYTLNAVDRNNPALVASTNVTFVRVGANVRPARVGNNLDRKVRWSVWGPPTGAKMYLHWTFKGRRHAVRKLGTAKGACGIARKKLPFLPAAPRTGTWKVYITAGKRFKRKRALFRIDLNVFRTFRSSAATVSAARVTRG